MVKNSNEIAYNNRKTTVYIIIGWCWTCNIRWIRWHVKVYRYDLTNAGIRSDPFKKKDIVMNGDTHIYNGNLYLTGDIHKETFSSTGTWTEQKM